MTGWVRPSLRRYLERAQPPPTKGLVTPGTHGAGPLKLARWLQDRTSRLIELWLPDVRARGFGRNAEVCRVGERFAEELILVLPLLIGPAREVIRPLWDRLAELYGVLAAKRGLAAGEVIEELHALRELVILDLYRDPPSVDVGPLPLREILRLNRGLDRAVALASVGHTDALFFEFFGGEDQPGNLAGHDTAAEAEAQLDQILTHVADAVRRHPGRASDSEES